jgi:hypothetical protein
MKASELKKIIKEELHKELSENDNSDKVKQLKKEIEGAFREVAMPSFDTSPGGKDKYSSKTPTIAQIIRNIEEILQNYK